MKKNKKTTAVAQDIAPEIAPEAVASPAPNFRDEIVAKAKAARQAALVGLIPQDVADALWGEAEAACKPSEESLALAKEAKEAKDKADKVLKAARDAFAVGLISEEVVAEAKSKADAAHAAYTEAAKGARGFSLSGGGGTRYKVQMSGLGAAYAILSESAEPMNAGAILKAATERGLWNPEGATPVATLSGALQTDVKKGEKARFAKVGAGLYAIRK
jgi:hypothetical protein